MTVCGSLCQGGDHGTISPGRDLPAQGRDLVPESRRISASYRARRTSQPDIRTMNRQTGRMSTNAEPRAAGQARTRDSGTA